MSPIHPDGAWCMHQNGFTVPPWLLSVGIADFTDLIPSTIVFLSDMVTDGPYDQNTLRHILNNI